MEHCKYYCLLPVHQVSMLLSLHCDIGIANVANGAISLLSYLLRSCEHCDVWYHVQWYCGLGSVWSFVYTFVVVYFSPFAHTIQLMLFPWFQGTSWLLLHDCIAEHVTCSRISTNLLKGHNYSPCGLCNAGAECEGAWLSCLKMSVSKQLVCFKLWDCRQSGSCHICLAQQSHYTNVVSSYPEKHFLFFWTFLLHHCPLLHPSRRSLLNY